MNHHPFDDPDAIAAWARSAWATAFAVIGSALVAVVAAVAVCWPLFLFR